MKIQDYPGTYPSSAAAASTTKLSAPSQAPGALGYSRPTLEPPGEIAGTEASAGVSAALAEELMADNPLTDRQTGMAIARTDPRWTSDDVFGAFSIESFAGGVGGLTYTHEDAQGFIDFMGGTGPANFWFRDGSVQPWAYYETYDNWQDTYGMDAVLAAYHSGHGSMDANGVFWAPLGAAWGSEGSWIRSDRMRLGNEQANYIFWSTCLSCRVLDGHNPIRTWSAANLGFRMLFGFETVSWDSPNYGNFFKEEWRKGKSLSTAWLDASWRIAHDQAPSAVACGASAAEAQDRLYNERFFNWNHVSTAYWWWRWYYASSSARTVARRPNLMLPSSLLGARLRPVPVNAQTVGSLVNRIGLDLRVPKSVAPQRGGSFLLWDGDAQLAVATDGSLDARFTQPNRENRTEIGAQRAVALAKEFVRELQLEQDVEVVLDRVRMAADAGGQRDSDRVDGPFVTETTVQFKQVIDGIPVIAPGVGEVRVSIDNDGHITSVHSSVRGVDRLHDLRPSAPGSPPAGPTGAADYEQKLANAFGRRLAAWALRGSIPLNFSVVPDSTEIGYSIEGSEARLVAQRAIEVDFGQGLRKRYWITEPISE